MVNVLDYASPSSPEVRWSRSAIAAFVAGMLGLMGIVAICAGWENPLPLLGFVTIPLAAVGLWRTQHTKRGRPLALFALLLGFISAGGSILVPATGRETEMAKRVKCASNMRQIGRAIGMYVHDSGGVYPPSLDVLFDYDIDALAFVCPSSELRAFPDPMSAQQADAFFEGDHLSYVYIGSNLRESEIDARTIVLYELPDNHPGVRKSGSGAGINVLYADGHAEFLSGDLGRQTLRRLRAGQNPPGPD